MKRRVMIFLFLILLAVPLALLAQDDPYGDFPYQLNDGILAAFQTVFGLGLLGVSQLVKNGLKKLIKGWATMPTLARHAIMYAATGALSAGVTYFILSQAGMMGTARFILYGMYAWGVCNGGWKALKELIGKHANKPV